MGRCIVGIAEDCRLEGVVDACDVIETDDQVAGLFNANGQVGDGRLDVGMFSICERTGVFTVESVRLGCIGYG